MSWTARRHCAIGRIAAAVVLVSFLLSSRSATAQPGAVYPVDAMYGPPPAAAAGAYSPGSSAAALPGGAPPMIAWDGGMPAPDHYGAGWYGDPAAWCPPGYPHFADGVRYDDGIVTSQAYRDDDWYAASPLEKTLELAARNSWFRLEYLLWDINEPGDELLGAGTLLTPDPRLPFGVTAGNQTLGLARVEDLREFGLKDTNGIRGTLGVPLRFGSFEMNAFALEQQGDALTSNDLPQVSFFNPNFVGTTVLADGEPSTFIRLYDLAFRATYQSDIWGSEANFVWDPDWKLWFVDIMPLWGYRYISVQEQLTQTGTFSDGSGDPLFQTLIDSDVHSHAHGVNIGFKAEWETKWFTVGAVPKVALGVNQYRIRVTTDQFTGPVDPERVVETDEVEFSPIAEISAYAKIHLSDNFSLFAGYNLTWIMRVVRPHDAIIYNVRTVLGRPVAADFGIDDNPSNLWFQGLIVGGELSFR